MELHLSEAPGCYECGAAGPTLREILLEDGTDIVLCQACRLKVALALLDDQLTISPQEG